MFSSQAWGSAKSIHHTEMVVRLRSGRRACDADMLFGAHETAARDRSTDWITSPETVSDK